MNRPPAYQHYAKDWFQGTMHLSLECQGAYLRLLDYEWVEDGLPDDPRVLAKILSVSSRRFEKLWISLAQYFPIDGDGKRRNPRLNVERQKYQYFSDIQSLKGKKSAKARASHGSIPVQPDSNHGSTTVQPVPLPLPLPLPVTAEQQQQQQQLSSAAPTSTPGTALVPVDQHLPAIPKNESVNRERTAGRKTKEAALNLAVEVVFRYWRDRMGFDANRTLLTDRRRARILARLRENGADVSELLYAVDGALRDDWTMGRDPRSTKAFNGTETLFKHREKVEDLLRLVPNRAETHPYLEADDAKGA